ncbi:inactive protein RESTRICTED TEV MOVEMENT 2 [Cajanus cajan]|uniref:16.6 kDa heat shock protein n=1 Tax=Cajanus cajan TaxID=3821 RepID=A0A151TWF8_CAJCA|nr:inactive protein RESTRICTED TEV MOVEMENT 2 [Cajanus cajan]KYP71407.1 16.6 kDa heat shock protein [Cajanus cajan]
METNAAKPTSNRLYEDFEPYCKWLTKEGQATLEISLKGFKKEQLKVQAEDWGVLRIYGERPIDASNNKWSRFHKEIRISKGCAMNSIRAKFAHGVLFIAMPKEIVMEKHFICGVETRKRRIAAIKLAIGMVVLVALGSYIVRLVSGKETQG